MNIRPLGVLEALTERSGGGVFGHVTLDRFPDDLTVAGEPFDEKTLKGLLLAGELAERAGLPSPAVPVINARGRANG